MPNSKRRNHKLHHRKRKTADNAYKYEPLEQGHIRLLRLLPGKEGDELTCSLITVPVDECPSYEALSYCWGDPEPAVYIQCDRTGYVRITTNLASGLRQIRYLKGARLLWADQICINQADIPERSAQVNIMGKIFEQALRVVIWLGPDDEANPQAPLAMELARKFASIQFQFLPAMTNEDLEHERVKCGLPPSSSPVWAAFRTLVNLPYFSRVWILQELALASTRVMLWGSTIVDFDGLCESMFNLLSLPEKILVGNDTILNYVMSMAMFRYQRPLSLLNLVAGMHTRIAKDQRDLIFALLGMLGYDQLLITADYSKSLVEVYTSANHVFVKEAPYSLDFLSFAGTQLLEADATKEWPSWVPNWTVKRLREVERLRPSFNVDAMETQHTMHFDSTKLRVEGSYLQTVSQVLQLDPLYRRETAGSVCDRLIATRDFCRASNQWPESQDSNEVPRLTSVIDTFLNGSYEEINLKAFGYNESFRRQDAYKDFVALIVVSAINDLREGTLHSLKDLEGRLSILDEVSITELLPESQKSASREFAKLSSQDGDCPSILEMKLLYRQSGIGALRHIDEIIEYAFKVFDSLNWTPEDVFMACKLVLLTSCMCGDWKRLPPVVVSATDRRRLFFMTEHGSIGMGPPAMRPGDIVAILFGAKAPFILRPTDIDGEYRLIGQCYVNGIMHGEYIKQLKAEGKFEDSTRTFTLV